MNLYNVTDALGTAFSIYADDKEEAQDIFITTCEDAAIVHGDIVSIVRV